ncbi:MAG: hypothetical protein HPY62_14035 [Bacteroidales bacterium]|nr:hypothetical protein [Bacteroidales bacterium]
MSTSEVALIIALFVIAFVRLYNRYVKKKGAPGGISAKSEKSFSDAKEDDYEPYSGTKS